MEREKRSVGGLLVSYGKRGQTKGRFLWYFWNSASRRSERETASALTSARCLEIVKESGLPYQLHAMGTLVEGELTLVLDVMKRCIEAVAADCNRVTCSAKIDFRRGHSGRLQSKVASVERQLGWCASENPRRRSLRPRKRACDQQRVDIGPVGVAL